MIAPLLALVIASPLADAKALEEAAKADLRLRAEGTCSARDLDLVRAGVAALEARLTERGDPARQWLFPVERVDPGKAIGGTHGEGYVVAKKARCYASAAIGHPAHDLFVGDPDQDARDPAGNPWLARAVEPGIVLVTHEGWTPGDPLKGGNYVMLYLPARRQIAYYAHLESVRVHPGEIVGTGAPLGIIGRTGLNAWPKRSPTHLHFALWDANTLLPVNPWPMLRAARRD